VKRRAFIVVAMLIGAIAVSGAQPVLAEGPADGAGLTGLVTNAVNRTLGAVPAPPGTEPRHACLGVDSIDWGMCVTFPFPT
jgi:hypothetical protein